MTYRQIKFRGKRKDTGEWVYGDLLHIDGGCLIYFGDQTETETPYIENSSPIAVELFKTEIAVVDPESVGQFTGLLDANGKDIYEGDIVKFRVLDDTVAENIWKEYTCEVSFCNGCFCTYGTPLIRGKWKGYNMVNVEIIGNIHNTLNC